MLLGLATAPQVRGQAGPVAHWKFDEPSGPTAFDSAGTNHGALSVSGAMFVPGGISGNAISLDKAANGLVNMGNVLSLTNGDHSIVAWVKTAPGDVTDNMVVVGKHVAGTRNGYFVVLNPNTGLVSPNLAAFFQGGFGVAAITPAETPVSTSTVNDGNWHQIVVVVQVGGTKRIYVDGAPAEDSKPTQAFSPNAGAFIVGGQNVGMLPTALFNGLIDDVQIYDRALTDPEIDFLFRNPGSEARPAANGSCTIPPNMIAWWKGDGNANDSVGSNHGLNVGGVTYAPGKRGMAFSFSGNGTDYIEVPANPSLDIPRNGALTVEMWALRLGTNPPLMHMFGKRMNCLGAGGPDTINYQMALNLQTTQEGLIYSGTYTGVTTGRDLRTNAWTHLVGTFDGTQFAFYLDGVLIGTGAGQLGATNQAPLRIGVSGDCFIAPFAGLLDEIAMYNRALTPAEVQALFLAGGDKCLPMTNCLAAPPGLVSMWRFEASATDSVGNNHGTTVGSPAYLAGRVSQAALLTNAPGVTNYFVMPASASLNVGTGAGMSIEGWINPTDLQTFQPLVEWNRNIALGADTIGAHLWINVLNGSFVPGGGPGALYVNLIDINNTSHALHSLPGVLASNVFNHVAMTYDRASGLTKLFVNGLRVGQTNLGSFVLQTSYDFYVGHRPAANVPSPDQSYNGGVDELSIYNRALTEAEVLAIAQAGAQGKYGPCVTNGIAAGPVDLVVLAGAAATFGVELSGSPPLSYQWTKNGFNIAGATGASLYITNASLADAGRYAVRVYYASGALLSRAATLAVTYPLPVITGLSTNQAVPLGGAATLSVTATGTAPLSYFWRKDGVNIPGATNADLSLAGVGAGDAGVYQVVVSNPGGSTVSSNIVLSVIGAPTITGQPTNQVVALGSSVSLTVTATGTEPLLYQWRFNRADLPGETNATLSIASAQVPDAGLYGVVVANLAGVARSASAELRFIGGPVIVTQPGGQTAPVGGSVTFDVGVLGDAPLAYQWRFNGAALPGKTNQSLSLMQLSLAAAGNYSVVVTNSLGLAVSAEAALTVFVPLAIVSEPVSQVVAIGGTARFSVGVVGTPPFSYQWLSNGVPITNAIAADLQLDNAQPAQSGGYSVVVGDARGSVTSSIAGLQVFEPLPSVVLFDGTDTSKFVSSVNGGPVQWPIFAPNILEVVPGTGSIQSTQTFTDFKLHLEFRTPNNPRDPVGGTRGNSGVYVQGRYEIQIFDSFGTQVPDGNDCGAIWGLTPPRVNACLAPGQWQTYDITFHAPQWNGNTKVRNAHATVVLNGVIVQDDVLIPSITQGGRIAEGPTAGPILLQDNGSRVQFRNVVVTPLDTSPTFTWGVSGGGSTLGDDPSGDLTVDSSGYSYFAAMYRGDLTVGTSVLTATTTRNAVFGKLDPSGKVVWLRRASSGLPHVNYGTGVAVDGQGNVLGVGTCERYISFLGQQFYPDGTDAFLAKYDSAGNEVWIRTGGTAVAADGTGNSYTAGDGSAVLTFGSAVLPAGSKGFVAKYDRNGNVVWVTSYSGATTTSSVRVDGGGNVYVGGSFTGTVTFGALQLTSVGQNDAFIAKLDSSGRFVWVRQFGAGGRDGVSGLALDPRGNLFAAGTFQATVTIGTNTLFKASNSEGVLVKYDASGNVLWARQTGGTSQKQMGGLAVDAAGGAYIVGGFVGPATFSSRGVTPSTNVYDVFVAKYDSVGDFVWARSAGGAGDKFAVGVGVDSSGNIFVGGNLTGSIVLDAQTLTTSGAQDFFVSKLGDNRVFLQGPLISVQPLTQDVGEGVTVVFAPTVGGPEPLTYQWRLNGTNLPGATNVNLLLNSAGPLDAGVYSLFVTNQYGSVLSSNAVLTVLGVPVVTLQPQDQQLHVGEDLNLRADAAGTPPLSYLWRFNGVNIPGATNLTLRVPNLTTNEAGEYFVIVSNPAGVALSQKAFVSVNPAPFVRVAPQDQSVALGTTAMLGVQLLGQPPFTYQWMFNQAALPGQTGATLSLVGVQPARAGLYSVAVTNAFGGVVSSAAQLTIIRPAFSFGRATNGSGGLALSFPAEATGFVLESSPTLGAGAVWTVVTNLATLPAGQLVLPIDPSGGPRYYRLRTP